MLCQPRPRWIVFMIAKEQLDELLALCDTALELQEGGMPFLYLRGLRLPQGCGLAEVDALLCLHKRDNYDSRLYLSSPVPNRGANWSTSYLFDRRWHTWSWQGVSAQQRAIQVLAGHLKALQ